MVELKSLSLNVKGQWFEQVKSGEKTEEYREVTPYWTRRLEGKEFKDIKYKYGYPVSTATSRILTLPWRGYRIIKGLIHPHFNNVPTDVYAIKLENRASEFEGN